MEEQKYQKFKARMMVKVPDVIVINVLKRVKEGADFRDVAKEYNVPANTVRGWCVRTGISVRSKKRDWETIKLALGIS